MPFQYLFSSSFFSISKSFFFSVSIGSTMKATSKREGEEEMGGRKKKNSEEWRENGQGSKVLAVKVASQEATKQDRPPCREAPSSAAAAGRG
jgi:hypothetical protein